MSDRKFYSKKGTGTIPKIKHRNNTQPLEQDRFSNVLSNNLADRPDYIRQNRRNIPAFFMESADTNITRQNGIGNGTSTPNTSRTNSRRNSVGTVPKCDNVAKYPDKKQIQTKLNQIQEYIRLTSSLMSNMKNSDEQSDDSMDREQVELMLDDLIDSEAKLLGLLEEIENREGDAEFSENGIDSSGTETHKTEKPDAELKEMQMLKEQENLLLHLHLSAESQLREARLAQEKLSKSQNQMRGANESFLNDYNDSIDSAASGPNQAELSDYNGERQLPECYQNQIDVLQNKIQQMKDGNDNRTQLIQMLDTQDAQLQAEHSALQGKLHQLQSQKLQIDQLVLQLQNLNNDESEDDEMGLQVKSIVYMKEQLAKLKDMLHLVQTTENAMDPSQQNVNESDVEDHVRRLCLKSDNLMQKRGGQDNSRMENNEQRVKEKQVNKKSMNANERERAKLQAELQAKKRELEELMCKHKAATSNLNQDVNSENKSDVCSNNPLYEGATNSWYPVPNHYNPQQSSEQYSSDDCPEDDMNEYSEVNSSGDTHAVQAMPALNYPTSNYIKRRDEEPMVEIPPDTLPYRTTSRTPDRGVGSSTSLQSPVSQQQQHQQQRPRINQPKNQVNKQIELIKSVCESMLNQNQNQPTVQLRNNLTPSPIYTEPRYTSPHAHHMNTLNIINPSMEGVPFSVPPFPPADANYQNWVATNNLQTQAFMLNTLNQCCQMLWLQQRELSSLRNTVNMMQDRGQNYDSGSYINACPFTPTNNAQPNNHAHRSPVPKINPPQQHQQQQHMVAGAASLPNLNHAFTNMDHACANHCNLQNAPRMLDTTSLNNAAHNHDINNSMCHTAVNQNMPTAQIWNGQALNNQVAPGNRANNYWDNFRSYSRQNLLSSKSNEGLQNILVGDARSNQDARSAGVKLNVDNQDQGSSTTSTENTPRRVRMNAASRQLSNVSSGNPPDVLNVNQLQKPSEQPAFGLEVADSTECPFLSFNDVPPENNFKGANRRNRNEWHDDAQAESSASPKSKLFEELRENVYKEVASLISANQGRPHFLIQLFRDLQLISSDPLRRRTLQSIQSVITSSLSTPGTSAGAMRQAASSAQQRIESEENLHDTDFFEVHAFTWPQLPKSLRNETEIADLNGQEHLSEVLTFLNNHNEDIFSDSLVHSLKDTLVESTFATIFTNTNYKDGVIQKHFVSLLAEALEQYRGKKVQDVRITVLQTIEDLLRGEISLIRLMRENISDSELNSLESVPVPQYDLQVQLIEESAPQMQNGDLAEADQSRIEMDEDDEGAVGGVLNILLERSSSSNAGQVLDEDGDTPKLDLVLNTESDAEFSEQGLDQVPTRLTTHPTSRSNTPNKDKRGPRLDRF